MQSSLSSFHLEFSFKVFIMFVYFLTASYASLTVLGIAFFQTSSSLLNLYCISSCCKIVPFDYNERTYQNMFWQVSSKYDLCNWQTLVCVHTCGDFCANRCRKIIRNECAKITFEVRTCTHVRTFFWKKKLPYFFQFLGKMCARLRKCVRCADENPRTLKVW